MDTKGFIVFFIAVPLIVGGCARNEPGNPDGTDYSKGYNINNSFDDKSAAERGGIKSFEYNGSGTAINDMFSYIFTNEEDGVRLEYDFYINGDEAEGETMLDVAVMDELTRLSDTYEIAEKWDGFDEVAEGVLDGSGFSLYMEFEDGSYMSASGYNDFPKGYGEFEKAFNEMLDSVVDKAAIKDKLFPKVIESENLNYISVDFHIDGFYTAGGAGYEFMARSDAPYEDGNTSEIYARNDEEKLFGEETGKYFSKKVGYSLEPFQSILKKYNIAAWNGYDEYSGESNEWFSIYAAYESEERITAYGSLAPEKYEEFKRDIINAFADFYKTNKGDFYEYD